VATKIAIINYQMGNLASVKNSCAKVGFEADIVGDSEKLKEYDKLILPGVGAFPDAMKHLRETGMDEAVKEAAKSRQIFGVCLGMQLLFEKGFEHEETAGLGLLKGDIVKFDPEILGSERKIPHMGWNKLFRQKGSVLLEGIDDEFYLYFVHSYHAKATTDEILCISHYGEQFVSMVEKENICGIQPHPEKSGDTGLKILKNFLEKK
jgi:glutamine amidotransferase